jgi:hypothetical protein
MLQQQMAATRILTDFKSSKVGTQKRVPLQHSSVQPTRAFLESISNMSISFCTKRNIFDRLWERVAVRPPGPDESQALAFAGIMLGLAAAFKSLFLDSQD